MHSVPSAMRFLQAGGLVLPLGSLLIACRFEAEGPGLSHESRNFHEHGQAGSNSKIFKGSKGLIRFFTSASLDRRKPEARERKSGNPKN